MPIPLPNNDTCIRRLNIYIALVVFSKCPDDLLHQSPGRSINPFRKPQNLLGDGFRCAIMSIERPGKQATRKGASGMGQAKEVKDCQTAPFTLTDILEPLFGHQKCSALNGILTPPNYH